jgi:hypothetical protein
MDPITPLDGKPHWPRNPIRQYVWIGAITPLDGRSNGPHNPIGQLLEWATLGRISLINPSYSRISRPLNPIRQDVEWVPKIHYTLCRIYFIKPLV